MKKLDLKLRKTIDSGLLHDSRKDSRLLMQCINLIVEKLNEVIEENNKLKEIIKTSKI